MRVYQFRDTEIARKIITDRRLKISSFSEMNDPFELAGIGFKATEFKVVPPEHRGHVERIFYQQVLPTLRDTLGVVCFSRAWANPLLWAHYADKHKGIALGFDIQESKTLEICPATYISTKNVYELGPLLDEGFATSQGDQPSNPDVYMPLFKDLLSIKFQDWGYEDEVRLFARRKEKIDGMYFVNFDERIVLSEVILGMRCPRPVIEIQRDLAKYTNRVIIRQAALSEVDFKIIEDPVRTVIHTPS